MTFLDIQSDPQGASVVLLGVPFDGCSSNRTGARLAPDTVRLAASSIETYSPYLKADMEDIVSADLGDVEIPPGAFQRMAVEVQKSLSVINAKPILIGGESVIGLPASQWFRANFDDLQILDIDARPNLQSISDSNFVIDRNLGSFYINEFGVKDLHFHGYRAGSKDELSKIGSFGEQTVDFSKPLFISIGMNVFDPAIAPGVANPSLGGMKWIEFVDFIGKVKGSNVVGALVGDFVPQYDPSGVTAVLTASIVRELILILGHV